MYFPFPFTCNKYDIQRIGLFIVLFTCRECRNIQDKITYNVLNLCHECRNMINPVKIKTQSRNQVK